MLCYAMLHKSVFNSLSPCPALNSQHTNRQLPTINSSNLKPCHMFRTHSLTQHAAVHMLQNIQDARRSRYFGYVRLLSPDCRNSTYDDWYVLVLYLQYLIPFSMRLWRDLEVLWLWPWLWRVAVAFWRKRVRERERESEEERETDKNTEQKTG